MAIRRTLTRVSTSVSVYYKKTLGHRIRDYISNCGHYFHPIKKYVFPNFIAVHYAYTILITILGSILMYPVRNHKYIDILFLACGAATQGGLNTIDVNSLTLYQQIIIYIMCMISTPIFIHGSLAFVRLYWFERHFDGIRTSSKRDFKMRRTRTILNREITARTMSRGRFDTINSHNITKNTPNDKNPINFQEQLFSGKLQIRDNEKASESDSDANARNSSSKQSAANELREISGNDIEPVGSSGAGKLQFVASNTSNQTQILGRRDSTDISPADMYRSIAMLQEQHQEREEDDGPALVIGAPNEEKIVEKDNVPKLYPVSSQDELCLENNSNDNIDAQNIKRVLEPGETRDISGNKIKSENINSTIGSDLNSLKSIRMYNRKLSTDSNPTTQSSNNDSEICDDSRSDASNGSSTINHNKLEYVSRHFLNNKEYQKTKHLHSNNIPLEQTMTNDDDSVVTSESSNSDYSASSSVAIESNSMVEMQTLDNNSTYDDSPAESSKPSLKNNEESNSEDDLSNHIETSNRNTPRIQFDITEPPRKRRTTSMYQDISPSPKSYKKSYKPHRTKFLRHIPKGDRIKKRIKRTITNNSFDKNKFDFSFSKSHPGNRGLYNAEGAEVEDSFSNKLASEEGSLNSINSAGNNGKNDEHTIHDLTRARTFDVLDNIDLQKLSESPEFQKAVYENWKNKHRKKRSISRNDYNDTGDNNLFHNTLNESSGEISPNNTKEVIDYFSPSSLHYSRLPKKLDRRSSKENENDFNFMADSNTPYRLHFDPDYALPHQKPKLSRSMSTNYLSWQPVVGRNSTFVGLNSFQKNELGGVEYRATKLLCLLLLIYYIGFHIITFIFLVPWIINRKYYEHIVRADGVSPAWWGFFTAMSGFNDLGLTLTPDSMISFNAAIFPLVVLIWFIIIGNTGFPILFRIVIWFVFKLSPDLSAVRESSGFLLDHPRRCFTLLFPNAATLWLLVTLIALNATDLILFIIFDFGSAVVKDLSKGRRVLVGLFQGVSTRTAGFAVVDLSKLHPAIQVSYMLMMYVSVLPLAISIRRTNVYEEQSLGIYSADSGFPEETFEDLSDSSSSSDESDATEGSNLVIDKSERKRLAKIKKEKKRKRKQKRRREKELKKRKNSTKSFVGAHLRRQLSFDLWYLFLGLFIICICEGSKIQDDSIPSFNIFSILFEIVSAYGTVGLSLGYPNSNQSFSGQFTTLSKLVIIALLIRGRARGLPYSVDRAIMLPSGKVEDMDHLQELERIKPRRKSYIAVSPTDDENMANLDTILEEPGDSEPEDPLNTYLKSSIKKASKSYHKVLNKITGSKQKKGHRHHHHRHRHDDNEHNNNNDDNNNETNTKYQNTSDQYGDQQYEYLVNGDIDEENHISPNEIIKGNSKLKSDIYETMAND
ncbi:hypothetical protein TPHA_0B03120 [Tetrapisispora phaffii CBS 4417]|uniref:Potassium transport protein n=1 Tax=Tetrapisispora phaffii (strain ATCC 24235 / CBS 4417 / NBRC 1672 / NRRL Y-8282 / UCD 70-5) TaxID=1071381 RepID=G8BPQ3_TETPH|nr:hypothetical protein TPHA_0B03120 [Tetrapisispora phaffii CBS 4417]CCE61984.1 hypothetical protein TPHA_0B03120 [Tetrapisispora phaffii CBS 4417]